MFTSVGTAGKTHFVCSYTPNVMNVRDQRICVHSIVVAAGRSRIARSQGITPDSATLSMRSALKTDRAAFKRSSAARVFVPNSWARDTLCLW